MSKPITNFQALIEAMQPTMFSVDYYVMTPSGSRTRFQRNAGLVNIYMAQSEFAVLSWLRKLHPGTEVIIRNLSFR